MPAMMFTCPLHHLHSIPFHKVQATFFAGNSITPDFKRLCNMHYFIREHVPNHDACIGVAWTYSFEFMSSFMPVRAAITIAGTAIVSPKLKICRLFTELAITWANLKIRIYLAKDSKIGLNFRWILSVVLFFTWGKTLRNVETSPLDWLFVWFCSLIDFLLDFFLRTFTIANVDCVLKIHLRFK